MGCFREVGTLGNLTHCCYLWGWGGCTGLQNGVGQARRRSGHIGDAGVLGLTAADVAE